MLGSKSKAHGPVEVCCRLYAMLQLQALTHGICCSDARPESEHEQVAADREFWRLMNDLEDIMTVCLSIATAVACCKLQIRLWATS